MLSNAFPRLRFMHIVRHNKLRQAVSKARAAQTGLWKMQDGNSACGEAQFDPDLIANNPLRSTTRQENHLEHIFLAGSASSRFWLKYEALCRDYAGTIRGVLNFLKISVPRSARIGPPGHGPDRPMKFRGLGRALSYRLLPAPPTNLSLSMIHV